MSGQNHDALVERLIASIDERMSAAELISGLDSAEIMPLAQALRKEARQAEQSKNAEKAMMIAELITEIGELTVQPAVQALGLQAKANQLTISQSKFEEALALYNKSEQLFGEDELNIAIGDAVRVWAYACLQDFDTAFAIGARARTVLKKHKNYFALANLENNLLISVGRRGMDQEALDLSENVLYAFEELADHGENLVAMAHINRAIIFRNLGRFQESIEANQTALDLSAQLDQHIFHTRSKQSLGMTYFLIGRITEGHALLEEARDSFLGDGRTHDAILADLYISDGLLHLRRYEDVIKKCSEVRSIFGNSGTKFEIAQAYLNEAVALAGLNRYPEAKQSLHDARAIFEQEKNSAWQVYTDLEHSSHLLMQNRFTEAQQLAGACASGLGQLNLPVKQAQAHLIIARADLALNQLEEATKTIGFALKIADEKSVPTLRQQAYQISAEIAQAQNNSSLALHHYEASIQELENLQGHIMTEFRADFLQDKQAVYTGAVQLCIDANDPTTALDYAERAKSRALLALLSHRVNLNIEVRSETDRPLVEQLHALREERDRLHRRWDTGEIADNETMLSADQQSEQTAREQARKAIVQVENDIRELWHRLLIRNSGYAREATLWQVQSTIDRSKIDSQTAILEYFPLDDRWVVFVITATDTTVHTLPLTNKHLHLLQQRLQHNFDTLARNSTLASLLTPKANALLHQLYNALIIPIADEISHYTKLVIVPHDSLHYLPFHALYTGNQYLIETVEVSYLPGASFVGATDTETKGEGALVMSHSQHGYLTSVTNESHTVSQHLNTTPLQESAATRAAFQELAPTRNVIHLATHGTFNADNPLFSGLVMQDGALTTLDIFNMQFAASLVTLSACQTGRTRIGGGDELFGLMRAFLATGASSLILTLWRVEDSITSTIMDRFYALLSEGHSKGSALRTAICDSQKTGDQSIHPYFWAPFFLIGDTNTL